MQTGTIVRDLRLPMVGEVRILNKRMIHERHKRPQERGPAGEGSGRVHIDLSHTIQAGLITYKGLPAPVICDFLSRADSRAFYDEGTSFQIGRIDMVAHTGTYLDSPFTASRKVISTWHRWPDWRERGWTGGCFCPSISTADR